MLRVHLINIKQSLCRDFRYLMPHRNSLYKRSQGKGGEMEVQRTIFRLHISWYFNSKKALRVHLLLRAAGSLCNHRIAEHLPIRLQKLNGARIVIVLRTVLALQGMELFKSVPWCEVKGLETTHGPSWNSRENCSF